MHKLKEKDFQEYIATQLETTGYRRRNPSKYSKTAGLDKEILFEFLQKTQHDKLKDLEDRTGDWQMEILRCLPANASTLSQLTKGITCTGNLHIDLLYKRPATTLNKDTWEKYNQNIFTFMKEVNAVKGDERIDLVIFINGIPIFDVELKLSNTQTYKNAIKQYQYERGKAKNTALYNRTMVHFALDDQNCYISTGIPGTKKKMTFIPFNKGKGEGINRGAGNDCPEDKDFATYYIWEEILKSDMVLDIVTKFMTYKGATLIFPRYHQIEAVQRVVNKAYQTKTSQNYLLQHSAGSGKTLEIAWLAYQLANLHTEQNEKIFHKVIVCTDRIIVDRQLQESLEGISHKTGVLAVMDDACDSKTLKKVLENDNGALIIATTAHKFLHIADEAKAFKVKRFAVIIDEAHSSTNGKMQVAINRTLDEKDASTSKTIEEAIERMGKPSNVGYFAFTATPKATTLELFGNGGKATHTYTMKQAIEEGFILDVLQNYTTYQTLYELVKDTKDDPVLDSSKAKREIRKIINENEGNLRAKASIITEHFKDNIATQLGGQAKAMVVCESRNMAVQMRIAIDEYINRKGYDYETLVAFTGKIDGKDESVYNEGLGGVQIATTMHNEPKKKLLVVANKFQTGYDEPNLCGMYILKKMEGTNLVQTLSRLNRVVKGKSKVPYILDFVNKYEDVENAFKVYYTTTTLTNSTDSSSLFILYNQIMSKGIITQEDVDKITDWIDKDERIKEFKACSKLKEKIEKVLPELKERKEFKATLRRFVRAYEFIKQVVSFDDTGVYNLYRVCISVLAHFSAEKGIGDVDLSDKVKIKRIYTKKVEEHIGESSGLEGQGEVSIPTATRKNSKEEYEKKLSEIVKELNERFDEDFENNEVDDFIQGILKTCLSDESLRPYMESNKWDDFKESKLPSLAKASVQKFMSKKQKMVKMYYHDKAFMSSILGYLEDVFLEMYSKSNL